MLFFEQMTVFLQSTFIGIANLSPSVPGLSCWFTWMEDLISYQDQKQCLSLYILIRWDKISLSLIFSRIFEQIKIHSGFTGSFVGWLWFHSTFLFIWNDERFENSMTLWKICQWIIEFFPRVLYPNLSQSNWYQFIIFVEPYRSVTY